MSELRIVTSGTVHLNKTKIEKIKIKKKKPRKQEHRKYKMSEISSNMLVITVSMNELNVCIKRYR